MLHQGTEANNSKFALRYDRPYLDPKVRRSGYTKRNLTTYEHALVVGTVACATACLARPICHLDAFYFLCDVPGESNRIFLSDKRAQFFHTLFHTRWWTGPPFLATVATYATCLSLYLFIHDHLPFGNTVSGFVAGSAAGAIYTVGRHPYDVLRATAEVSHQRRAFKGPGDVLMTSLKEKPSLLLGIFRGVTAAALGRAGQLGLQFGLYNVLRYDGVYRHPLVLFAYCHAASVLGEAWWYPFVSLKQQLREVNGLTRGKPHTYRSLLMEIRRRHGITKVYDGYCRSKPLLRSVPSALLMVLYDYGARSYTEYLHPELKSSAAPEMALTTMRVPTYARQTLVYEFDRARVSE